MSYDDVEIEDMEWNDEIQAFTYPCPCGDLFQITKEDLRIGEEIARCPSCSLYITVIYNMEDFQDKPNKKAEPPKPHPIAVAWEKVLRSRNFFVFIVYDVFTGYLCGEEFDFCINFVFCCVQLGMVDWTKILILKKKKNWGNDWRSLYVNFFFPLHGSWGIYKSLFVQLWFFEIQ